MSSSLDLLPSVLAVSPNRQLNSPPESLVGCTKHHIMNRDFVQKLSDLTAFTSQSLVSFDVTALFTPTEETVKTIRQRLTQNLRKKKSPSDQIIQLPGSCFDTTYFTFKGNFYKQGRSHGVTHLLSLLVTCIWNFLSSDAQPTRTILACVTLST